MADVRYTITLSNIATKSDAVVLAAVQNVDVTPVLEERARDFTLCDDSSAIDSPGVIKRIIIAELSTEFETKFPTFNDQFYALKNAFKQRFEKQLPASGGLVSEVVEIGAYCP